MLGRIRPHLTYASVMVTVLAFVVLGGGAYASSQLAAHSVGTRQLKSNAVTSAKVKNHTLTASDISASSLAFVPSKNVTRGNLVIEAIGGSGNLDIPVMQRGPLTISANCIELTGGPSDQVDLIATSTQAALMGFDSSQVPLVANTPVTLNTATSTAAFDRSVNYSFLAQDGTMFTGVYSFGVHVPPGDTAANCGVTATAIG